MKVHHIGYAVKKIDKAIKSFADLGYAFDDKIEDEFRKVEIAFAKNGDIVIELVAPLCTGSPVDSILEKNGAVPYHICYEVESIADTCKALKQSGWVVLRKPAPAPAFDGAPVAFLYNQTIGLIEVVEMIRK